MAQTPQTPNEPLAADRPRRRSIVGPTLLIVLGGLLLLNNLGVLPWEVWGNLWRLWPLVLILVGLELLVGHRGTPLWLFVIAAVVVVGALAVFTSVQQTG